MLKPNVLEALNGQLQFEFGSSYLYLSMAADFESRNFRGMARWMRVQAAEEWKHGMKLYDYIVERGGRVSLRAVDAPKAAWGSVLEVFQDSYSHECKVTARIYDLAKLATAEGDLATQSLLRWFIDEQVEEEAQVQYIVEKLKMMGDGNIGLVILDGELGKRGD